MHGFSLLQQACSFIDIAIAEVCFQHRVQAT